MNRQTQETESLKKTIENMMKEHKSVQGPMPQPKARTMKVMTPEGVEVEGEVIGDFAI